MRCTIRNMGEYEDLDNIQKEALIEAFGQPSDYQEPSLVEVDIAEVAEYDNLRSKIEGLSVEKGSMESEVLESYLNRGILAENEDGTYELNSVWKPQQLEKMEKEEMIDTDKINLYSSETPEATNIRLLETGEGFHMDIEDGVTFNLKKAKNLEQAEYESANKIQEMTEDFIEFFASDENSGDEPVNSGYMNTSSKPTKSENQGGEQNMTEEQDVDVPMTAAHAIAYEAHENLGQYDEVVEDDLYNLDVDEKVALGTAAVMHGVEEDEYEDFGWIEIDEFVEQYGDEFNDEAFKRYKGQMGGNQFDEDLSGIAGDEVDEMNRIKQGLGTDTVLWEAAYREKAADNEEAQEIIQGVLEQVSRLDTGDSRLQSSRRGLQIAENTEKKQSQKASDIDDLARNL